MKPRLLDEPRLPSWFLFLIQMMVVVPVGTFVAWMILLAPTDPLRNYGLFGIRRGVQDLSEDLRYTVVILVAGVVAGLVSARFFPSLRSSGRWMWVLGVVLFAWSLEGTFRQYMIDSARASYLLTFVGYISDFNHWLDYAYICYSTGIKTWDHWQVWKSRQTENSVPRYIAVAVSLFTLAFLLTIPVLIRMFLKEVDPGPIVAMADNSSDWPKDAVRRHYELGTSLPRGSSVETIESYLDEHKAIYVFDAQTKTLYALLNPSLLQSSNGPVLRFEYHFDDALKFTLLTGTEMDVESLSSQMKNARRK